MPTKFNFRRFYLPSDVMSHICKLLDIREENFICDPACGSGVFLKYAFEHIKQNAGSLPYKNNTHFYGFDREAFRIEECRKVLHEVKTDFVHTMCINTLGDSFISRIREGEIGSFNIILSNPPFKTATNKPLTGGAASLFDFNEDRDTDAEDAFSVKSIDIAFIKTVLELLCQGGRAAVIVPDSFLYKTAKKYREVRRDLIENHQVNTIVSFPSGLFQSTMSKCAAIVFTKGGKTEKIDFYDIDEGCKLMLIKHLPVSKLDKIFYRLDAKFNTISLKSPESIKQELQKIDKCITDILCDALDENIKKERRELFEVNPLLEEEWSPYHIGDLVDRLEKARSQKGDTHEAPAKDGEWGILKVSSVSKGLFLPSENKRCTNGKAPSAKHELCQVQKNDLLIVRADDKKHIGVSTIVRYVQPCLIVGDKLWRIRLKPNCRTNIYFFYILLNTPTLKTYMEFHANGTTRQQNLREDDFYNLPILLPSISTQNLFKEKLCLLWETIFAHQILTDQNITCLQQMLLHIFSGDLSVEWWKECKKALEQK